MIKQPESLFKHYQSRINKENSQYRLIMAYTIHVTHKLFVIIAASEKFRLYVLNSTFANLKEIPSLHNLQILTNILH